MDVIALVPRASPTTVAPLGTALTEDQLAAALADRDEPILCFDGDEAGTRAAYRAVDLALPQLTPGKRLSFAFLPEGQDPDDLVPATAPRRCSEVLGAARPLSECSGARDREAARSTRPSGGRRWRPGSPSCRADRRRAGAPLLPPGPASRLHRLLAPERGTRTFARSAASARARAPSPRRAARVWAAWVPRMPQFAQRSVAHRTQSGAPPREALILLAAFHHPWLLTEHAEELSELDFAHRELPRAAPGVARTRPLPTPPGTRRPSPPMWSARERRKSLDAWTVPLPIRAIGRCGRGPHARTFSRSGTRS